MIWLSKRLVVCEEQTQAFCFVCGNKSECAIFATKVCIPAYTEMTEKMVIEDVLCIKQGGN